eukprot:201956-Amphidinium_carterae.1
MASEFCPCKQHLQIQQSFLSQTGSAAVRIQQTCPHVIHVLYWQLACKPVGFSLKSEVVQVETFLRWP